MYHIRLLETIDNLNARVDDLEAQLNNQVSATSGTSTGLTLEPTPLPTEPPTPEPITKQYLGFDLEAYQSHRGFYKAELSVKIGGVSQKNAISCYLGSGWGNINGGFIELASFNLSSQYTTISGKMGHIDGTTDADVAFNIIGDSKIIQTFTLKSNMFNEDILIYVKGITQLKIEVDYQNRSGHSPAYAFWDMEMIE